MFNVLTQQTERRRPAEERAWQQWLQCRESVWQQARAHSEALPPEDVQISDVDEVMVAAFDSALVQGSSVSHLQFDAVARLRALWKKTRQPLPTALAGTLPIAISTTHLKEIKTTHLR